MFEVDALRALIEAGIPGSTALVEDNAGDREHFAAQVVAPSFEGLSLIKQHQAVYRTLGERMGREIHALALTTFTPAQWAQRSNHG